MAVRRKLNKAFGAAHRTQHDMTWRPAPCATGLFMHHAHAWNSFCRQPLTSLVPQCLCLARRSSQVHARVHDI